MAEALASLDADGSGEVGFDEFLVWWGSGLQAPVAHGLQAPVAVVQGEPVPPMHEVEKTTTTTTTTTTRYVPASQPGSHRRSARRPSTARSDDDDGSLERVVQFI